MLCLEVLFDESDGIEIIKYNNEIYRIDTVAAFTTSYFLIHLLAYDYKYNNINIREFSNKTILESAQRNTDRNRLFY